MNPALEEKWDYSFMQNVILHWFDRLLVLLYTLKAHQMNLQ